MIRSLLLVSCCVLVLAACDSAGPDAEPVPLNVRTAMDIPADPVTVTGGGPPASSGRFTLYDLDTGDIVLSSSVTDPAVRQRDSVSTVWDLGFRGTTIIVNGGMSGPGDAEAQLLTVPFAELEEAPAGGYLADGENTCPAVETPGGTFPGAPYAICTGSGNGWYNYVPQNNLITPVPGRTIALRTTSGHFAKLRILSYYQGNPNPPDPAAPSRYYTFEYIVQPDGTRDFAATTGL